MSRAHKATADRVVDAYAELVMEAAQSFSLEPELLLAMICQESAGNATATRKEPAFLKRYRPGIERIVRHTGVRRYQDWLATDPMIFATSIGLLQVLNIVAIERGVVLFTPRSQDDPACSLDAGCRQLDYLRAQGVTNERKLLLRWNGGGNALYPDEVQAWRRIIRLR